MATEEDGSQGGRLFLLASQQCLDNGKNGEERLQRPYINNGTRFTASAINPQ